MARGRDYITADGHRRLREELDYLWREKRPAVTRALADAAAEGDRSENAEYIYRKKELREIDRRLRYLSKRLDELIVPARRPDDPSRVFFGAEVTVADDDGTESTYRIVGADETDARAGWISVHSPVARALLGRGEGDSVMVRRPAGEIEMEVVAVRYP
ncbi:transcription elongation factor GreB [Salinisphaera sp. PC39]|uniref:transcription elongation factor GreB n=1 Tax=Salinisphaera sp. PC39 TaxID=1304156 RepID=UPI00334141B8